jgi:hypothetical protein
VAGGCGTPLTAFFRLNAEFKRWAIGGVDGALCHFRVDVSKLLYHSVPKYFTLRKDTSARTCEWIVGSGGAHGYRQRLRRSTTSVTGRDESRVHRPLTRASGVA